MLIDGHFSQGTVGLNLIMCDDLEEDIPTTLQGVLVAENSYGQILKLRWENRKVFMDDPTSQRLDAKFVEVVRKLEMDYVKAKGLWLKRPTKE